jgi:hypothetical protein
VLDLNLDEAETAAEGKVMLGRSVAGERSVTGTSRDVVEMWLLFEFEIEKGGGARKREKILEAVVADDGSRFPIPSGGGSRLLRRNPIWTVAWLTSDELRLCAANAGRGGTRKMSSS